MIASFLSPNYIDDFIEDEIIDINLLRDFRYVPMELDMPDGSICCLTATRFISYRVLSECEKHIDFATAKISSKRSLHIDKRENEMEQNKNQ